MTLEQTVHRPPLPLPLDLLVAERLAVEPRASALGSTAPSSWVHCRPAVDLAQCEANSALGVRNLVERLDQHRSDVGQLAPLQATTEIHVTLKRPRHDT